MKFSVPPSLRETPLFLVDLVRLDRGTLHLRTSAPPHLRTSAPQISRGSAMRYA